MAMSSSISLANSKMVSEPLVLKEDGVVTEVEDYATNVFTLCVLVLLTCTAASNSTNVLSSIIVMVMVVELIDYDQRSLLIMQSVDTMEYPD